MHVVPYLSMIWFRGVQELHNPMHSYQLDGLSSINWAQCVTSDNDLS